MFKKVLFTIILWPLDIVAGAFGLLLALMFVLLKPIYAAFGFKEMYNECLGGMVYAWDKLKDACKFDD